MQIQVENMSILKYNYGFNLGHVKKKNWTIEQGEHTYGGRSRVLSTLHCQARNSYRICKDDETAVNIM